jgi:hypothetical protein
MCSDAMNARYVQTYAALCPGKFWLPPSVWGDSNSTCSDGGSHAGVEPAADCTPQCTICAWGYSSTSTCDTIEPEIELYTEHCMWLCEHCCPSETGPEWICWSEYPHGYAWAVVSAFYTFTTVGAGSAEVTSSLTMTDVSPVDESKLQFNISGAALNGTLEYATLLITSPYGSKSSNLGDNGNGDWSGSGTIDWSAGSNSVWAFSINAGPTGIDANGDGRSNSADASYIATQIGQVNEQLDFDGDGLVDQHDVDLYNSWLALGLDQGVMGDLDDDGDYDCDDYGAMVTTLFAYNLGDAGYMFELDENFDGKLDIADYNALRDAFFSADFDGSGFVDTDDHDAFMDAFNAGDPSADFDRSGFVDTDDVDAFMIAFNAGC